MRKRIQDILSKQNCLCSLHEFDNDNFRRQCRHARRSIGHHLKMRQRDKQLQDRSAGALYGD